VERPCERTYLGLIPTSQYNLTMRMFWSGGLESGIDTLRYCGLANASSRALLLWRTSPSWFTVS